jgi:hypothetical protein
MAVSANDIAFLEFECQNFQRASEILEARQTESFPRRVAMIEVHDVGRVFLTAIRTRHSLHIFDMPPERFAPRLAAVGVGRLVLAIVVAMIPLVTCSAKRLAAASGPIPGSEFRQLFASAAASAAFARHGRTLTLRCHFKVKAELCS